MVLAAGRGDTEAFAAFVRSSEGEIRRFCRHVLGTADAEDAVQETYLAAWRAAPQFRGESSARTWLFSIARRTAERLGRRRRRLVALDGALRPPPSPAPPELAAEPAQLLSLLDHERRLAIVLTQLLGLSYAEAAEVCECAVGTIRSRVARAREQLLEAEHAGAAGRSRPRGTPA